MYSEIEEEESLEEKKKRQIIFTKLRERYCKEGGNTTVKES